MLLVCKLTVRDDLEKVMIYGSEWYWTKEAGPKIVKGANKLASLLWGGIVRENVRAGVTFPAEVDIILRRYIVFEWEVPILRTDRTPVTPQSGVDLVIDIKGDMDLDDD